jgi:hypothetical protein
MITETADPAARVIWGILLDETMQDEIAVTVIATGFDPKKVEEAKPVPQRERARQEIKIDFPDFSNPLPAKAAPTAKQEPVVSPRVTVTNSAAAAVTAVAAKDAETADEILDSIVPRLSFEDDATDVDRDHDTVIGMLVDKFQRERGRRNNI